MEKYKDSKCSNYAEEVQVEDSKDDELLRTLEQRIMWNGTYCIKYKGFWFQLSSFKAILSTQKYFKAEESDIILSTIPKSGTTWLKALAFCIAKRHVYSIFDSDNHPLRSYDPHTLVPFFEYHTYGAGQEENPDLEHILSPRIFSTHIPFNLLPDSIRESECRIIYVCRNPLDQFISHYHFMLELKLQTDGNPLPMDEAFDMFCEGIHTVGPFWGHMLGYWNAYLENPEKVLFLKYEDLKEDITLVIDKIAKFIGIPFSVEEQKQGVIEQISRLCSFNNLTSLEVNKTGSFLGLVDNSSFFRKGQVGDWKNHLTPAMADRVTKLMKTKLEGSGLEFNI